MVFEWRRSRAIGPFEAGDFASYVHDRDVLVEVADTLDRAGVGRSGHGAGLFCGKKFFNLGRTTGALVMRVDEIAVREKESGHRLGIVFIPGSAPFVMPFVNGSILLLLARPGVW